MTNAIISLALTIAIATTLGGAMASTAYRETAVRAMHADQVAPIARERTAPTHVAAS